MEVTETITIDLDSLEIKKLDQIALDSPFYSRDNFIYAAIRQLLDKYADPHPPPAVDRFVGYNWFLNSTRYY